MAKLKKSLSTVGDQKVHWYIPRDLHDSIKKLAKEDDNRDISNMAIKLMRRGVEFNKNKISEAWGAEMDVALQELTKEIRLLRAELAETKKESGAESLEEQA